MTSRTISFVLPWTFLFFFAITAFAKPAKLIMHGGLSVRDKKLVVKPVDSSDFETFFYNQTIDHFNYRPDSYAKFNQRYVINSKYWGGAESKAPIFVWLGAEAAIDGDMGTVGFMTDNAASFKALLVYIEHRFYGESRPFGLTMEEALSNANVRGYFNSAQALEDYAEVIRYLKEKLNAHFSPVIVLGGSYGGMLASWFRLKYPHVALGALASSAPILYFDDITPQDGYFVVVTKDFKETSRSCYNSIRESWGEIQKLAAKPDGLATLSKIFKTCAPLTSTTELTDYLDTIYALAAQYGSPPVYEATTICNAIDGASNATEGLLGRIFAGVEAYVGKGSCYDLSASAYPSESDLGWDWQSCSDMVMPIGYGPNSTMYPHMPPFNLSSYDDDCKEAYGVMPRQHWITNYFGGHDIKLILQRFGSNIIFSNGLRDPYSSAGVLEDVSSTVVSIKTEEGSHCMDIYPNMEGDPHWLTRQRQREVHTIRHWIKTYYSDLRRLGHSRH